MDSTCINYDREIIKKPVAGFYILTLESSYLPCFYLNVNIYIKSICVCIYDIYTFICVYMRGSVNICMLSFRVPFKGALVWLHIWRITKGVLLFSCWIRSFITGQHFFLATISSGTLTKYVCQQKLCKCY